MARFLLTWELGGGFGHLLPLGAITRQLVRRGHHVTLAVRNPENAHCMSLPSEVDLLPSPYKSTKSTNRFDPICSFAHVLHNTGMGTVDQLSSLVRSWRSIIKLTRPDLVLCDHSPNALLAARIDGCRRATLGTGFFRPLDKTPWAPFRPDLAISPKQLMQDENAVLDNVNCVLKNAKATELETLAELYGPDVAAILTTFEEMDHYPQRSNATYWGPLLSSSGGVEPHWPHGHGPRLFAYLKNRSGVTRILELLRDTGYPTVAYIGDSTPQLRETYQSNTMRIADQLVDMKSAADSCDIGICHAGHGTMCDFLMAARPMLLLPITLEQAMCAARAERCGFAVSLARERIQQIPAALKHIEHHDSYRENVARFQMRYADYSPNEQLKSAVSYMESLTDAKAEVSASKPIAYSPSRHPKQRNATDHRDRHRPMRYEVAHSHTRQTARHGHAASGGPPIAVEF